MGYAMAMSSTNGNVGGGVAVGNWTQTSRFVELGVHEL
jgi:hypothetical protein